MTVCAECGGSLEVVENGFDWLLTAPGRDQPVEAWSSDLWVCTVRTCGVYVLLGDAAAPFSTPADPDWGAVLKRLSKPEITEP